MTTLDFARRDLKKTLAHHSIPMEYSERSICEGIILEIHEGLIMLGEEAHRLREIFSQHCIDFRDDDASRNRFYQFSGVYYCLEKLREEFLSFIAREMVSWHSGEEFQNCLKSWLDTYRVSEFDIEEFGKCYLSSMLKILDALREGIQCLDRIALRNELSRIAL